MGFVVFFASERLYLSRNSSNSCCPMLQMGKLRPGEHSGVVTPPWIGEPGLPRHLGQPPPAQARLAHLSHAPRGLGPGCKAREPQFSHLQDGFSGDRDHRRRGHTSSFYKKKKM